MTSPWLLTLRSPSEQRKICWTQWINTAYMANLCPLFAFAALLQLHHHKKQLSHWGIKFTFNMTHHILFILLICSPQSHQVAGAFFFGLIVGFIDGLDWVTEQLNSNTLQMCCAIWSGLFFSHVVQLFSLYILYKLFNFSLCITWLKYFVLDSGDIVLSKYKFKWIKLQRHCWSHLL